MAKHAGNRTGREAKRRRRRHERRLAGATDRRARRMRNYVWEPVMDTRPRLHVAVDLAAGPDRVVSFSRHASKAWLLAETVALIRSGRIVFPPLLIGEREEPLTDSELAMRFALESMEHARKGVQLGLNAGGESDLRAYYCEPSTPPKKGV